MPSKKYRWNEAAFRYETARGKPVPWARGSSAPGRGVIPVAELIEKQVMAARERMRVLGEQLQRGAITLPEWQIAMRAEVKTAHVTAGAAARGGWAQMSQADWGRVGSITRFHYEKLNNLGLQIEQGLRLDGRFLNRVQAYAKSARNTFFNMLATFLHAAGKELLVARVRSAKESCAGCIASDGNNLGFIPLNEMLAHHPIGSKECLFNCLCSFVFQVDE